MRGRFIAFEGGEGTGKSTQARLLADRLDAVLTREPGGTDLGEALRALVLDPAQAHLGDRAEALLFAAARAQHVDEVIAPALDAGRDVVCDRFAASSLAYQAYGRGLDLDAVRGLSSFAVRGVWPDLQILLELPADVAASRLGSLDRLEQAGDGFHARVTEGFVALAGAEPARWARVDAAGTIEEVAARVHDAVTSRLGTP